MYLYHKVAFVRRMVSNFMTFNGLNVTLNPVISVPNHLKVDVVANLKRQLKKPPIIFSTVETGTPKLTQQRRYSCLQHQPRHNTMERTDTEGERDQTRSTVGSPL